MLIVSRFVMLIKTTMAKNIIQNPKGMHDILPVDQPYWDKAYQRVHEAAASYNFLRIETPIVESADVFEHQLGETSDVVEKQMFFLKSKGRERLVLRPEATAAIARAYIQHGMSHLPQPLKLYYWGPMFRYEQPQAGRVRQLYQGGFEIISPEDDPIYDSQVILACHRVLETLKVKNLMIQINSIGCRICRPHYRKKLIDYYRNKEKSLCVDCRRRLKINPLRLLDCKNETCIPFKKDAPSLMDHLCVSCKRHFKGLLEYLEELKLPYTINSHLVRGFDYYSQTVFEIFTEGNDLALGAGGRYNYLIESLGGRYTPGVGGALGIDRIVEVMKNRNVNVALRNKPHVYFIYIGDLPKKQSLAIIESLRSEGIEIYESLGKDSLSAQLRSADKAGVPFSLIFGQQEAFEESIIIRDMKTGAQETVPLIKVVETLKRKLEI